jgi:hypothetical protein
MQPTSRTLQRLKECFEGKVCSIFTTPINRSFDEVRSREHFVVRIQEIGNDGIWGTHPYNNTISFFGMDGVLFLCEEVELDPNNPEHKAMIEEFEKKSGKKIVSDVSPHLAVKTDFVPPENHQPNEISLDAFKAVAERAKKTYSSL